jgi:hypothetical protein
MKKMLITATFIAVAAAAAPTLAAPPVAHPVAWIAHEAPPPLREEHAPPPRHGYVWVPGYWTWQGRHYVWHAGTWVRERHGYHYVTPTWVERNGHWEFHGGRWDRHDRDHDGVPNAIDRRPNNPNRS